MLRAALPAALLARARTHLRNSLEDEEALAQSLGAHLVGRGGDYEYCASAVSAQDARCFFDNCGYCVSAQRLDDKHCESLQ